MPDSDWWIAIAVPPALELLGFFAVELFSQAGLIKEGGSVLALAVPGLAIVTSILLIPVFALGLYKDASTVQAANETWDPNPKFWGALGLVPIVGVALSANSLMFLIATFYFIRRFRSSPQVTIPGDERGVDDGNDVEYHEFGGETSEATKSAETTATTRTAETNETKQQTNETAVAVAPADGRLSRWWYGIAIPLCAYGFLLVATPIAAFLFGGGGRTELLKTMPTASIFFAFALGSALLIVLLSIPVYAAGLFFDARAVAESDVEWTPDVRVWGAVGALHLLNVVVPALWLVSGPAGVVYLWKRRKSVGTP